MAAKRAPGKEGSAGDRDKASGAEAAWIARRGGVRPIGLVASGVTKLAFRRKSPLFARLVLDWEAFIGPRLSCQTQPRRLSAGSLTLACAGPVAMEIQHFAPALLERINTACGLSGEARIVRLRVVQDYAAFSLPGRRPAPRRTVEVSVEGIGDDALRDALGRLGGRIAARRQ